MRVIAAIVTVAGSLLSLVGLPYGIMDHCLALAALLLLAVLYEFVNPAAGKKCREKAGPCRGRL